MLSGCINSNGKKVEPEIRYVEKIVKIDPPKALPYVWCETPEPTMTLIGGYSAHLSAVESAVKNCNQINQSISNFNTGKTKELMPVAN